MNPVPGAGQKGSLSFRRVAVKEEEELLSVVIDMHIGEAICFPQGVW